MTHAYIEKLKAAQQALLEILADYDSVDEDYAIIVEAIDKIRFVGGQELEEATEQYIYG